MTSFYLSASHKSSGKTSVSIGLAAAMVKRGISVQTFKRGPDYIDPIWLTAASGRPCYNLDFNSQSHQEIEGLYSLKSKDVSAHLIEGSKGLYDGVDPLGSDSNAALAKLLSLPIVLVIDCMGMTRGIAPLLLGYQAFDQDVNIAGVILNKTGGSRHEGKLRQAIENYTNITVMGALANTSDMEIPERHLGLMPANEMQHASAVVERITKAVEQGVDLNTLLSLGQQSTIVNTATSPAKKSPDITIAIAKDAAFGFYYADDLEAMSEAGAKIILFDTLHDTCLPPCDGLLLGGGFPETHMQSLSQNKPMLQSIKMAIDAGLPCYAECGGLMYLCNQISYQGESANMVGVIPGSITMLKKPQGRGLVKLQTTKHSLWPQFAQVNQQFNAHEFHYAKLEGLPNHMNYAYEVKRGFGIDGQHDGLIIKNCLASFSHLRNSHKTPWVSAFIDFVKKHAR